MENKFLIILISLFILIPFPLFSDGESPKDMLVLINKPVHTYAVHTKNDTRATPLPQLKKSKRNHSAHLQKINNGRKIKGLLLILSAAASGKKY